MRRLFGVVLLVEDEPSVRTVTRRMMEGRGLTVLLAEGPVEALRLSGSYPGRIDVLLTDMLLPEMDGPELAGRLRATRPELKVVYISGYPREEAFAHSADDGSAVFLQKPFTPAQLCETLALALVHDVAAPTLSDPDDLMPIPSLKPQTREKPKP